MDISYIIGHVYNDLIYNKGAMVLRMLHFLLSDPSTGSGQPFFDMMSDFVKQYQNRAASTEDFMRVAGAHFANAPLGKMFGLKDLGWFFQQWVFEAKLPSYRMEYKIEPGDNNSAVVTGTIFQANAGPNWFMPLPVVFKFPGDQMGRAAVYANGPETAFKIPLPMKPSSVELDPDLWVLSEKTGTRKK